MMKEVKCRCGREFYIDTEKGDPEQALCRPCVKLINRRIAEREKNVQVNT